MRFRQILLILFVTLATANVLAQSVEKTEMIDSFGIVPNGDLRGRLDLFLTTLQNNPASRGQIVYFGDSKQIPARRRLIQNHIAFRMFDPTRVTFTVGGSVSETRSELWVIPKGAEPPKIAPEARIEAEFGKVTKRQAESIIGKYFKELSNFPSSQGYIVNYGSAKEIAQREKWIISGIGFRTSDRSRITLVRGGNKRPSRTFMWIIPVGAANPPA